jgi:PadR family transcriptional regulator, regulatory protein PadR
MPDKNEVSQKLGALEKSNISPESSDSSSENVRDSQQNSDNLVKKPTIPKLSSIDEAILIAMSGKELYGLQIVDAFNTASDGTRTISSGTLYPILTRLELKQLISSRFHNGSNLAKGGARRKLFKITDLGRLSLSEAQKFRNDLYQWRPTYGEAVYN